VEWVAATSIRVVTHEVGHHRPFHPWVAFAIEQNYSQCTLGLDNNQRRMRPTLRRFIALHLVGCDAFDCLSAIERAAQPLNFRLLMPSSHFVW
jgi:hypothetical protein